MNSQLVEVMRGEGTDPNNEIINSVLASRLFFFPPGGLTLLIFPAEVDENLET